MSSKSPNRRASTSVSEREREKRLAAKARRQAARASQPIPEMHPLDDGMRSEDVVSEQPARTPRPAVAAPKRDSRPTVSAAKVPVDAEAPVIPMGDPRGDVAMWLAFVLCAMLALLAVMIVAAS